MFAYVMVAAIVIAAIPVDQCEVDFVSLLQYPAPKPLLKMEDEEDIFVPGPRWVNRIHRQPLVLSMLRLNATNRSSFPDLAAVKVLAAVQLHQDPAHTASAAADVGEFGNSEYGSDAASMVQLRQPTADPAPSAAGIDYGHNEYWQLTGHVHDQGVGSPIAECMVAIYTLAGLMIAVVILLFIGCCSDPKDATLRAYRNRSELPHVHMPRSVYSTPYGNSAVGAAQWIPGAQPWVPGAQPMWVPGSPVQRGRLPYRDAGRGRSRSGSPMVRMYSDAGPGYSPAARSSSPGPRGWIPRSQY